MWVSNKSRTSAIFKLKTMEIINERIMAICRKHEDIEGDYSREHSINNDLCEYITELELKLEQVTKDKDTYRKNFLTHINNFENE